MIMHVLDFFFGTYPEKGGRLFDKMPSLLGWSVCYTLIFSMEMKKLNNDSFHIAYRDSRTNVVEVLLVIWGTMSLIAKIVTKQGSWASVEKK